MINTRQKALLHIYKGAAGLFDQEYQAILLRNAGVRSSADRRFSQADYDQVMAVIEGVLFARVHQGLCVNPIGRNRHISRESYWRDKCPPPGMINVRQRQAIIDRWGALVKHLPYDCRSLDYLLGIATKAAGRPVDEIDALTDAEAGALLDALADRLAQFDPALKAQEELVPF